MLVQWFGCAEWAKTLKLLVPRWLWRRRRHLFVVVVVVAAVVEVVSGECADEGFWGKKKL
jgi:hypothetical protein